MHAGSYITNTVHASSCFIVFEFRLDGRNRFLIRYVSMSACFENGVKILSFQIYLEKFERSPGC